ncbi:MAG: 3-phosphoshikimate 1-carboxyvinyltransferase [Thermodesulfobacteriota bacterium]
MKCMESDELAAKDIRQDPCIRGLLDRMPEKVAHSLSDEQLCCLRNALGAHRGSRHKVDLRGSFGLWRWRYYYVFLAGRERRHLSRKELRMARTAKLVFVASFLLFSTLTGVVIVYLLKSALGINLLPKHSLGLWGWFKAHVLQ